jgi:hypothetical protein
MSSMCSIYSVFVVFRRVLDVASRLISSRYHGTKWVALFILPGGQQR